MGEQELNADCTRLVYIFAISEMHDQPDSCIDEATYSIVATNSIDAAALLISKHGRYQKSKESAFCLEVVLKIQTSV